MAEVAGRQAQHAQLTQAAGAQTDLFHQLAIGRLQGGLVVFHATLGQAKHTLLDTHRVLAHQQHVLRIGQGHHQYRLVAGAAQALVDALLAIAELQVQGFDLEPGALGQQFGLQDGGQAAHGGLPWWSRPRVARCGAPGIVWMD
ncbi:hypothetical protein D3C76_1340930 [compost metagenome]